MILEKLIKARFTDKSYEELFSNSHSNIKQKIKKLESTIKLLKRERREKKKKNFDDLSLPIEKTIREKEEMLANLTKPVKCFEVMSLRQLEDEIGEFYLDKDDIKHCEQLCEAENKSYYIFQAFDDLKEWFENMNQNSVLNENRKTVISIAGGNVYKTATNKLNKNSKYAIITPITNAKETIYLDDVENAYLENNLDFPEGTILLVPKGEKASVEEYLDKNGFNIYVLEYDGNEIGEYPRTFIRTIEGYDPENLTNKDLSEKLYGKDEIALKKVGYGDLIFILQDILSKRNELKLSLEEFEDFLKQIEINGKYESISEIVKRALELDTNNDERIKNAFHQLIDELKKNGIKCEETQNVLEKLFEIGTINKRSLNELIHSEDLNSQVSLILLRNNTKSKVREDFLVNVFLQMLSLENGRLDLFIESKLCKAVKTNTNELKEYEQLESLIEKICNQPVETKDIYMAFQRGLYLLNKNMESWNKIYIFARSSGAINYKGKKLELMPKTSTNDLFESKKYYVKSEEKVITAARVLHLMNRLAHTYDSMIENTIISEFYGSDASKETKKSREYRELRDKIEQELDHYPFKREKNGEESFYDILKKLFYIRDGCFECKHKLIVYVISEMYRQNQQQTKYLYGYIKDQSGIIIVIDVPGYDQISFHIRQDKYEFTDIARYVTKYPFTLIKGERNNTIQTPTLALKGIDKFAKREIGDASINEIIKNIFKKSKDKEEAKKDVHKYLIRAGYTGEEIINLLGDFDELLNNEKKGEKESVDEVFKR